MREKPTGFGSTCSSLAKDHCFFEPTISAAARSPRKPAPQNSRVKDLFLSNVVLPCLILFVSNLIFLSFLILCSSHLFLSNLS